MSVPDRPSTLPSRVDYVVALGLAIVYVACLLGTVHDLGYARDEGFYFQAAQSYERWFELLSSDFSAALERSNVDRFWAVNHEHPSLMKSLFALSHRYGHAMLQLFRENGTAYRFAGMLVSSLAVSTVYLWGRELLGRTSGLVAALLLALMPQVFYHSHLACFDMPVTAIWLLTSYVYYRSLGTTGVLWPLAAAICYGLLLDTKHNSWLLPFALVAHLLFTRGKRMLHELRAGRVAIPKALPLMALVGPLVFYALWPWIWNDTGQRLADYVAFHTGHEYYNMEFLGRTYWEPPMPRLYAWVMTVATVPAITLLLFGIGFCASFWHSHGAQVARLLERFGQSSWLPRVALRDERRFVAESLWALCLLVSYAPWLSSNTPIFGGTKHWLTAYPFLCLFAGRGFLIAAEKIQDLALPGLLRYVERLKLELDVWWVRRGLAWLLAASVLVGPLVMTARSHPWGLSFYAPLVGEAGGAASLGLNRTFWGYTTGAVQDFINQRASKNGSVYVHDTALQSWEMMRVDGRIRKDVRGTLAIHGSDLALYHHETHMGRVEYQVWIDYGTARPAHLGVYDGVPIVWVYERPKPGRN